MTERRRCSWYSLSHSSITRVWTHRLVSPQSCSLSVSACLLQRYPWHRPHTRQLASMQTYYINPSRHVKPPQHFTFQQFVQYLIRNISSDVKWNLYNGGNNLPFSQFVWPGPWPPYILVGKFSPPRRAPVGCLVINIEWDENVTRSSRSRLE